MKNYEVHLTPKQFDPIYDGRNSAIYRRLSTSRSSRCASLVIRREIDLPSLDGHVCCRNPHNRNRLGYEQVLRGTDNKSIQTPDAFDCRHRSTKRIANEEPLHTHDTSWVPEDQSSATSHVPFRSYVHQPKIAHQQHQVRT